MKQKTQEEVDKESLKSLLDLGQGCAAELFCFSKSGETNQREVFFFMLLFSRNTADMLERGVWNFFLLYCVRHEFLPILKNKKYTKNTAI